MANSSLFSLLRLARQNHAVGALWLVAFRVAWDDSRRDLRLARPPRQTCGTCRVEQLLRWSDVNGPTDLRVSATTKRESDGVAVSGYVALPPVHPHSSSGGIGHTEILSVESTQENEGATS